MYFPKMLLLYFLSLFPLVLRGQQRPVESATSDWLAIETGAVLPFRTPSGPSFSESFTEENPNGWPTGLRAGFTYTLKPIGYQLERRSADTSRAARAWVTLSNRLNLNKIDTFLIQIDLLPQTDTYPAGGLLFGVADSLNYSQIRLIGPNRVLVQQVVNGKPDVTFVSAHLARATVALRSGRNRIAVWRRGRQLHVFVNEKELPTSPFAFRPLRGNGVGVLMTGNWLSFRNLSVRTQ
ncbi:MAG: hypothetical protein EAZ91_16860 [Cytophagales bacterium]|nr:MAG: hypothetical protein EAZ91_16860 [Cytophagales bacterium]